MVNVPVAGVPAAITASLCLQETDPEELEHGLHPTDRRDLSV
jgi:hypothetical protein